MKGEPLRMEKGSYKEVAVAVAVAGSSSPVIPGSSRKSLNAVAVAVAFAFAFAVPIQAQEQLGTISFPNSGNQQAQAPFLKGMKLYWSFEYDRAAEAFQEAQKADPTMTLAYVGEALTHTHQVWNQQNLTAGRAALAKLAGTTTQRLEKAKTPRERMYGELAEVLYGDGSKAKRDTIFTAYAERLSRAYPTDDEAKMFHAAGLLGLNQSERDFTTYMQAGALAEEVLRRNPDHPAAAHFVIHAFDDPVHAPLGLWAARLYSKIAPGAPHAQHMTTHIFVAMGMWDDVIAQNIIAAGHDHDKYVPGHYTWWLGYGYVQAGRFTDARKHLETVKANLDKGLPRASAPAYQMMRAHYVLDGERWNDSVAKGAPLDAAAVLRGTPVEFFVHGFASLKRGDSEQVGYALAGLGNPRNQSDLTKIMEQELRGAIASKQGKHDEAIALLKQAAEAEDRLAFEFGPPAIPKPTTELYGEVLLAAGKPGEAVAAFKRSLARTPGRSRSLIGLARAASASGDKASAATAVAQLKANWHAADKDLPELAELTRLTADGAK
jgi:tetratricopeptide (TPR) repeat protein